MIVVANPSGGAGNSFAGLHAYCAHDADQAPTSERVDWISTRNVAADPNQAWKVMAATHYMADQLKADAGIQAGRKTKTGPVLHLVMSFAEGEPTDRESMESAVDQMLGSLGADPAKMRGKSKPKQRQFADEHQAVIYAHSDTKNTHLHVMVNTVHPEHGTRLPTSNNFDKLQAWAGKFSKEHGTDHRTPARQENRETREDGEYVKGAKRVPRNLYEIAKELRSAVNDNDHAKGVLNEQKAKDAALLQRGRDIAANHAEQRAVLDRDFKETKADLSKTLRADIGKAASEIRETYRPKMRDLKARQARELETFTSLETSFFGRASNMVRAMRASTEDVREEKTGVISRSFRILTNAGERKAFFDRAQQRERSALRADQARELKAQKTEFEKAHFDRLKTEQTVFLEKSAELKKTQAEETAALRDAWKQRTHERETAIKTKIESEPRRTDLLKQHKKSTVPQSFTDMVKAREQSNKLRSDFNEGRSPAREQDNARDRDRGRDDD
ncbi:MAG: relaxase/mobilization nuclease domain-containing protein [Pseudomonadota bacterium]